MIQCADEIHVIAMYDLDPEQLEDRVEINDWPLGGTEQLANVDRNAAAFAPVPIAPKQEITVDTPAAVSVFFS